MARFYATMQGNRGAASRMGTPASGISAHPRGWNVGVRVSGMDEDGEDVFYIFATAGSAGNGRERYIGTVRLIDGEPTFTPAA